MTWLHRLVVVVLLLGTAAARHRPRPHQVPLDGGDWTLYSEVGGVQVAGSVPGGVYSDLRAAGQLPKDLFYRFNDEDYRWVAKANWTYDRSFQVPRGVLAKDKQVLVLHGVDTVAEVRLNGRVLGTTDNMFVRYRFDVKGILKDAHNRLQVRFTSPTAEASRRAAEQDKQYPVPPACPDASYHGECGVNHLRKMQASFSWDWGPAFPSMGLWKSVHIEAYTTAVLRNVGFTARPAAAATAKRWDVAVRAYWEVGARPGESPPRALLSVTLTGPDGKVAASEDVAATLSGDAEGAGFTDVALFLPKDKVQMWWPSGYGAQPLYTVHVALRAFTNWGQSDRGDLWDQMTVKSGFRTVELVQEPVDEAHLAKGLTYYFRVNGVAVFAKGSNWIPAHVLPELGGDPGVVGHLLHSAKEANMNMLRVWGGGVYESDLFYELADELGIMVWQDLMFACAMYPVGSAFLRSVDTEVRQQYRRLNRHPSVVVWAGNNENEAALRGDWYHTQGPLFEQYHRDYVKLYVDTARAAVRAEGLATPFAVSSPSNGAQSEADGFLAENPYSSLYGDDHHYDYLSDAWNPAVFHNTRFGSEYGFMSWPKRPTMMDATDSEHADEDLALGSTLAASRQHHPGGNLEIAMQIMQHLPLPQDFNKSEHFDTVAYYSQVSDLPGHGHQDGDRVPAALQEPADAPGGRPHHGGALLAAQRCVASPLLGRHRLFRPMEDAAPLRRGLPGPAAGVPVRQCGHAPRRRSVRRAAVRRAARAHRRAGLGLVPAARAERERRDDEGRGQHGARARQAHVGRAARGGLPRERHLGPSLGLRDPVQADGHQQRHPRGELPAPILPQGNPHADGHVPVGQSGGPFPRHAAPALGLRAHSGRVLAGGLRVAGGGPRAGSLLPQRLPRDGCRGSGATLPQ
ncbi:beta-mannosidase-like isoform X2 [Thrips palmi]|uniref:beta-mannosidase n=1 Tax=Thrips palmi TaxID=161013 RepID=A0A6P9A2C6_THRPL|nr:beta-mannosidase-like isoform X2 [Thrips palmi]